MYKRGDDGPTQVRATENQLTASPRWLVGRSPTARRIEFLLTPTGAMPTTMSYLDELALSTELTTVHKRNNSDSLCVHLWHILVVMAVSSCLSFCPNLTWADQTSSDLPDVVNFGEHIRPIFTQHCTACHGGVKQAADLSFVYRESVLPPEGWIVEPGEPDDSVLMERVSSTDPNEVMPPPDHGKPLGERQLALLRRWIEQGAPWEAHWAYSAPVAPQLPKVLDPQWCRVPLDYFVLARLEREQWTPSPEAPADRWLRRVSLDLTGLPPTPEERADFLNELGAEQHREHEEVVYQRTVERLLASPHFGERWASVWLDQIRYADSRGLGIDGRRNVWKYRDWVIAAINADMPYDEFTVKQIAGDLLPGATIEDRLATAAHRVSQSNEEGGTDDEEFRTAAVLDRVNTTWQTWQGVTFGCVQCHNHPYAPFEHAEYYRFAAFFNNTSDSDLNEDWPVAQIPLDVKDYARASELDREITSLEETIWKTEHEVLTDAPLWQPLKLRHASTNNQTQIRIESKPERDEYETVGTVSRDTDIMLLASVDDVDEPLTAIRLTLLPLDPATAIADSEWGFSLSHVAVSFVSEDGEELSGLPIARLLIDEPHPFFDPQASLDEKSNRGFAAYSRIHYARRVALLLESPAEVPPGAQLRIVLKHRVFLLGAFPLIAKRGHVDISTSRALPALQWDETLNTQRKRLTELRSQRREVASTAVPVLTERPNHLRRPTHLFVRGLFLTKGEAVAANTPAAFPPLPTASQPDRLALAQWLVSQDNPLTARVAVNRLWARLFGTGLVSTEEDFGVSGEAPSHPQLLDHLAIRFSTQHQWSMKGILKEMVLSSAYRQSSKVRPKLMQRDAANRLLARGPRHRLSAEMVRDQALAVSGLLSRKMYGPPVRPPIPSGVWKPFDGGDKWSTPGKENANRYRRSIYTYTKRSIPYPMFAAFDAPSREFCAPRRLRSNTPLQALMTLNDTTFVECTEGLAERMRSFAEQPAQQIEYGFTLVTCRQPSEQELAALVELYNSTPKQNRSRRLFTIATVLLNLDEFVTK